MTNPMTLTQELAQALREKLSAYCNAERCGEHAGVCDECRKDRDLLARYDADPDRGPDFAPDVKKILAEHGHELFGEPPTSRGSEGEVKPACCCDGAGTCIYCLAVKVLHEHLGNGGVALLTGHAALTCGAAPQPAQPSAEAWRQAIEEARFNPVGSKPETLAWIERRAREISKGSEVPK